MTLALQYTAYVCRVYTLDVEKRGLSAYDNKRYLLEDGVHTLAFGHRDIPAGEVEVGEAPVYPEEHIEARLDIDRAMPPPARPPATPLPQDPIDYVMFAALHQDRHLPTLPGLSDADFEMIYTTAMQALRDGRPEVIVRQGITHCLDNKGDADAFTQSVLSI